MRHVDPYAASLERLLFVLHQTAEDEDPEAQIEAIETLAARFPGHPDAVDVTTLHWPGLIARLAAAPLPRRAELGRRAAALGRVFHADPSLVEAAEASGAAAPASAETAATSLERLFYGLHAIAAREDGPALLDAIEELATRFSDQPDVADLVVLHWPRLLEWLAREPLPRRVRLRSRADAVGRRLRLVDRLGEALTAAPATRKGVERRDAIGLDRLLSALYAQPEPSSAGSLLDTLEALAWRFADHPDVVDLAVLHWPRLIDRLARAPLAKRAEFTARAEALARLFRVSDHLPDWRAMLGAVEGAVGEGVDKANLDRFLYTLYGTLDGSRPEALLDALEALAADFADQPHVIDLVAAHWPRLMAQLNRAPLPRRHELRARAAALGRVLGVATPRRGPAATPASSQPAGTGEADVAAELDRLLYKFYAEAEGTDPAVTLDALDGLAGRFADHPDVIDVVVLHWPRLIERIGREPGPRRAELRGRAAALGRVLGVADPGGEADPPAAGKTAGKTAVAPSAKADLDRLLYGLYAEAEGTDPAVTLDALDGLAGRFADHPDVIDVVVLHWPRLIERIGREPGPRRAELRGRAAALGRVLGVADQLPDQDAEEVPSAKVVGAPDAAEEFDRLLYRLYKDADRENPATLLDTLEGLVARFADLADIEDVLTLYVPYVVQRMLAAGGGTLAGEAEAGIARRLAALAGNNAASLRQLALWQAAHHRIDDALATCEALAAAARGVSAEHCFEAAQIAADIGAPDKAAAWLERAAALDWHDRKTVLRAADALKSLSRHDDVVALLRRFEAGRAFAIDVQVRIIAALFQLRRRDEMLAAAAKALIQVSPVAKLSKRDQSYVVEIGRRLAGMPERSRPELARLEERLTSLNKPSALLLWLCAMLRLARVETKGALDRLDAGLALPAPPADMVLNLAAEKAMVEARYHRYGEALAALAGQDGWRSKPYYQRRLEPVERVAALCPQAPSPLRFPECLIDVILAEVAQAPLRYEAQAGHVAMISASLGQGGGERQTINLVRAMLGEPRIGRFSLLVRSTHLKANDDFFLPHVLRFGLPPVIYGENWHQPSAVATVLPELAGRPRLAAAIDLLPYTIREDTIRLCRAMLDLRPQTVHIRQDITGAVLACAIVGPPCFFVHRGSLSPDCWEQTELQTQTHFRPLRHAYRRLLERPEFLILNNSAAGGATDRKWTAWSNPAQFPVVYNAVDFAALGPRSGPNHELRRELGVPTDAMLVGGSFRLVPVKRPLHWIEAARRVAAVDPGVHFLIIGDGDLADQVRAVAVEHGFADRLHLPGRVQDVGNWYRAMDVKLLTSEREGLPNAIIEAQHFGVPVVATDVGGIAEAIEPGATGFVTAGGEPGEYADLILRIRRDPAWLAAAKARAPDFVHERFSLPRIVDELVEHYAIAGADPHGLTAPVERGRRRKR